MIDPLLLDIPDELRTERLRLRAPRAGDGPVVAESVRESLAELKIWMPWATDDYVDLSAEQYCRRVAGEILLRKHIGYLLFEGDVHVGNASLFEFDWTVPSCEIGYWLRTSHCGRGLMTEAVRALVKLAFESMQMRRILITTDDANLKSARVAERCGFKLEGILRNHRRNNAGQLNDTRMHALLRDETSE